MIKRNISIMKTKVEHDLRAKCTTAVIADVFLNALPLDREAIANESVGLTKFVNSVVNTMEPTKLFHNAAESTKGNAKHNYFVRNLASAIEGVVTNKAAKGLEETKDIQGNAQEISDRIKMDKDDIADLLKASRTAGTTEVAEIVKKKVVDTIRDEKAAYDEAQQTKKEVKDMLTAQNDESDELADSELDAAPDDDFLDEEDPAVESYLNVILTPVDVRAPISFFSKLNDICLEAAITSNEEYDGEIPFNTLERIAIEMTLPHFTENKRNSMDELTSLCAAASQACESVVAPDSVAVMNKGAVALICTICVTTLIETLKTLHLLRPSINEVMSFVSTPTNVSTINSPSPEKIETLVDNIVSSTNANGLLSRQKLAGNVALGSTLKYDMEIAKENLLKVKDTISKISMESDESRERIIGKLTGVIEQLDGALTAEVKTTPQYGHFVSVMKDTNIAAINRSISALARKPGIQKIIIKLNGNIVPRPNTVENVEFCGVGVSNEMCAFSVASIQNDPSLGGSLLEIVKDALTYATVKNIPIEIFLIDSARTVPVND